MRRERDRIIAFMRIDLRDPDGRRLGRVEVDPAQRPDLVRLPGETADAPGSERFLNWEGAIDDGGHLRTCVVCGSSSLYRGKVFPQVTPFVVLLAFAGAVIGFLGYATNPLVLPALLVLLLVDIATLALARERLVCYRCGSIYARLRIARYHSRWSRTAAERVRKGDGEPVAGSTAS